MEKAGGGGGKKLTRGQATSFGFKRPQPAQQEPKKPVQNEVAAYGFRKPSPTENGGFKKVTKSDPAPASFKKTTTEHVNQPPVTVQETIQPLLIAPVQPKPPVGVVQKEKPVNRFGFRGPALSNKVADIDVPINSPAHHSSRSHSEPRKYRLEWSQLPRAQCAVRVPVAAGYSAEADKRAKTAANTALSSVAPTDTSRVSKPERCDSVLEIQQLEHSPSMANKFRQTQHQLQLQHEQNLHKQQQAREANRSKSDMVLDLMLQKGVLCSEDLVLPLRTGWTECAFESTTYEPGLPRFYPQLQKTKARSTGTSVNSEMSDRGAGRPPSLHRPAPSIDHMAFSSNDETGDEGFDETSTEEKQTRDKEANEKDMLGCGESPTEEMWGRGEAMAIEEELCANFTAVAQSPATPPLRSVLLKIEDPTFAPLAAMSQSTLLEDETLPDSPDLSCSSPSSVEPLPPPPLSLSAKGSPGSPGTPTHGTNSLSGSDTRDRDFLIDDEIADQPGLVFDNRAGQRLVDSRTISKLADEVSEALASVNPKLSSSRQSVSTLSPCDSLTSDDLIADFDTSDLSNFDEMDDAALKSELQNQSGQVIREWSSLLSSHPGLKSSRRKIRLSGGSTSSGPRVDSPQSISSPVRNKRLGMNSPGDDGSDDSGIRVDRGTYQHMFQDVINIKSMLVRLQRILQEDTGSIGCPEDEGEELADLRRQVVLLCAQLDERNRRISKLEEELCKRRPQVETPATKTAVNKATQTDRVRPVTTSQALFQTSPDNSSASFVSCMSEKKDRGAGQRCIPRRVDSH